MDLFLTTETNRKLTLLNKLYYEPTQTINQLCEQLQMDKRTLLRTIEIIKYDLASFKWQDSIDLLLSADGKSVMLIFFKSFNPQNFIWKYRESSILYQIVYDIVLNRFDSVPKWSANKYVSVSTVHRHMRKLKKILAEYQLLLDCSQNIRISGTEKQIRFFLFNLFWDTHSSLNWPFEEIDKQELILHFPPHNKHLAGLSPIDYEQFYFWVAISLLRAESGNLIEWEQEYDVDIYYSLPLKAFKELVIPCYPKSLQQAIYLENELKFLYLVYQCLSSFTIEQFTALDLAYLLANPTTSFAFYSDSLSWIQLFQEFFQLAISPSDFFYLMANLTSIHTRAFFFKGPDILNDQLESLEKINANSPLLVKQLTKFIQQNQDNPFFQRILTNSPQLVPQYALLTLELVERTIPTLTLYVSSVLNANYVKLLGQHIQKRLDAPIIIAAELTNDVDLIISDNPIPQFCQPKIPTVHLSHFSSELEWLRLREKIEEILMRRNK